MFFSENAAQKIMNGENVIIMPVPGKKWDPEASQRRLRAKYPELNNITKASLRRMRREWGR